VASEQTRRKCLGTLNIATFAELRTKSTAKNS